MIIEHAGLLNMIYIIIPTRVFLDNLKACPKFARHSNNLCMPPGFQLLKYMNKVHFDGMLNELVSIMFRGKYKHNFDFI